MRNLLVALTVAFLSICLQGCPQQISGKQWADNQVKSGRFQALYNLNLSPDQTKIAFSIYKQGSENRSYALGLISKQCLALSPPGSFATVGDWSPDGRYLFRIQSDGEGIEKVDVRSGKATKLPIVLPSSPVHYLEDLICCSDFLLFTLRTVQGRRAILNLCVVPLQGAEAEVLARDFSLLTVYREASGGLLLLGHRKDGCYLLRYPSREMREIALYPNKAEPTAAAITYRNGEYTALMWYYEMSSGWEQVCALNLSSPGEAIKPVHLPKETLTFIRFPGEQYDWLLLGYENLYGMNAQNLRPILISPVPTSVRGSIVASSGKVYIGTKDSIWQLDLTSQQWQKVWSMSQDNSRKESSID